MEEERWKPVVGYEGVYSVSNLGRVRRDSPGPRGALVGRILKPGTNGKPGYECVHLSRGNKTRFLLVHRLVAAAFIGPCPTEHEVNHINGDKRDNRLCNLEYVTKKENVRHALTHGLCRFQIVPPSEHQAIRDEYARGVSTAALAERYGIGQSRMMKIVRGARGTAKRKLSHDDVRKIRALYASGTRTQQSIADEFGITQGMVGHIVRRFAYTNLQ